MGEDGRRSKTLLVALLAGVGLVIVIAIIAVLTRGAPEPLPAGTPEGVVQRYTQAVVDGDLGTARRYLVSETADSCDPVEQTQGDSRVTLVGTKESGDSARVDVVVTTVTGSGPLGADEYESDATFTLVREGGDWLVSTAPWQFVICAQGIGS